MLLSYFLSFFFHEFILNTILSCELLLIWDMIMTAFGIQGIYYFFHGIHNIFIGYKTYINVHRTITLDSDEETIDPLVLPILYGLHIYHILKYYQFIRLDEIAHHLLCLFVAIPLVICNFDNRNLLGFSLFATTGWSTVFHYFTLFLYKNHIMSKRKTLQYNFITNTFFRSPLILFNSAFLIQYMVKKENISTMEFGISTLLFAILVTNALYFQYKVTQKYFQSLTMEYTVHYF